MDCSEMISAPGGHTAFQRPSQEEGAFAIAFLEQKMKIFSGSSLNINMLEEFIWASLKPWVTRLGFFRSPQKLSQLGRTVGFYYILLFQQSSH